MRYFLLVVLVCTLAIAPGGETYASTDSPQQPVVSTGGMTEAEAQRIVHRLYRDILHREPDPSGLKSYITALISQNKDEAWLRETLLNSEERRALLAREETAQTPPVLPMTEEAAQAIIRRLYRDILHREPDPSGLQAHTSALVSRGKGEQWLRDALLSSQERQTLLTRTERQPLAFAVSLVFVLVLTLVVRWGLNARPEYRKEGIYTTVAAITLAILTYSAIVSLWGSLAGDLDHDEYQFMASAFLVADYGLHPYQDFAYFHMPNLVYLYALFCSTPYPFVLARIFVGLCGLGICAVIFLHARSVLFSHGKLMSLIVSACLSIVLLHSPLFVTASTHVWNHTPSTFCAVLSFLLHCRAISSTKPLTYFFWSGLSLGMAIGIRLSFAPLILPFLSAIFVFSSVSLSIKRQQVFAFAVGGLLANIVALFFFFSSYQDFWFGNLGYAELNTIYRQEASYAVAMTLVGKIQYMVRDVFSQPSDFLIVLITIYGIGLFLLDRRKSAERPQFETMFLLLSLPFVYLGCIAPTPSFPQYYFALIPFFILFSLSMLSSLRNTAFRQAVALPWVLVAVVSFVYTSPLTSSSQIGAFTNLELLTPLQLQHDAAVIRQYVDSRQGHGKVLTLSPLYALMARLPIYTEFATGPFGWRVSHLLTDEEARSRGLPVRSHIQSFLEKRRPRAILTGREEAHLEAPFITAARKLGYQSRVTPSGIVVWLSPE